MEENVDIDLEPPILIEPKAVDEPETEVVDESEPEPEVEEFFLLRLL